MFQKQVSLVKFLFPYLAFQQIVFVCSVALVSWLHFSRLELIFILGAENAQEWDETDLLNTVFKHL